MQKNLLTLPWQEDRTIRSEKGKGEKVSYEEDPAAKSVQQFEEADEQLKLFIEQNRMVCEKLQELATERDKRLDAAKQAVLSERRTIGSFLYAPRRSREYDADKLKKEVTPSVFKQVTTTSVDLKAFDAAVKKGHITLDQVKIVTVYDEKKPGVTAPKGVSVKSLL